MTESPVMMDVGGMTLEQVTTDLPCVTPTCTGIATVVRGVLRQPGHVMDGRVLLPGSRHCDACKVRRNERAEQLAQQQVEYSLPPLTPPEKPQKPPHRHDPIPPDLLTATWDRVPPGKHREILADWPKDPDSIYLFGGSGAGKSMLVSLLVQAHIDLDPSSRVVWRNVSIMLDKIRRSINKPERTDQLIDEAVNADVLILDDLGAEAPSRWTLDRLYVVLEDRIEQQRPTVITSNYSMTELRAHLLSSKDQDPGLPKAVDRLISRIRGKHRVLVPLQGRDQRIHGAP